MHLMKMCIRHYILFLFFVLIHCDLQVGPDPWDLEVTENINHIQKELDVPPDLRTIPQTKRLENGAGANDWFYKRILAIMLKTGQVKKEEDGTVIVSLEMKFEKDRWQLLEGYTAINFALTDDMIRRSLGYIEEAIYKPTIIEKAAVAWIEYIQMYLVEYKMYLTWTFGILACLIGAMWLRNHVSHKHICIIVITLLYLYEVFTSYKEAEKEDLQRFLSAVNSCKWYIWSTHCDVPPPDPLIFIKYMNPLKIGMRMFASVITEPIISINETAKILIHGITDGLWFPLDKILYGILVVNINILIILFLIMIVFNYILNIPFSFSYLGLLNIVLNQRNRSFKTNHVSETPVNGHGDRISGDTLNRLLDICSRALSTAETTQNTQIRGNTNLPLSSLTTTCKMRRSASTGRLPNSHDNFGQLQIENSRKLNKKIKANGRGDEL